MPVLMSGNSNEHPSDARMKDTIHSPSNNYSNSNYNQQNNLTTIEDKDLEEAMRLSILEETYKRELTASLEIIKIDPNEDISKRITPTFPGIQNIGNSCYLNALIQTYVRTFEISSTILQFRYDPQDIMQLNPSQQQAIDCILELQKIISYLLLCKIDYINITRFHCLLNVNYEQQDINEYHQKIMKLLKKAYKVVNSDISHLFYQKIDENDNTNEKLCSLDIPLYCEENEQKIAEFNQKIMNFTKLEQFIEFQFYSNPKIHYNPHNNPLLWMNFHHQKYNSNSKSIEKLYYNRLQMIISHNILLGQFKFNGLSERDNALIKYSNSLESVKELLNQLVINNKLQHSVDHLTITADVLQTAELAVIKEKSIIDSIQKEFTYKLIAIIIHQGSDKSGHYYCYVKHNNQFYECNDSIVTRLTEDMRPILINPELQVSIYTLVYSKVELEQDNVDRLITLIPPSLRDEISSINYSLTLQL